MPDVVELSTPLQASSSCGVGLMPMSPQPGEV
jgi:hypothetical protein